MWVNMPRSRADPARSGGVAGTGTCVALATATTCAAILGEQAFAGMAPGAILVDHTTAFADKKRSCACCGRAYLGFLDAPVSGISLVRSMAC